MKSVYASYDVLPYLFGINEDKDEQIRKIMESYAEEGSGSGFGQRDISFRVHDNDCRSVSRKLKNSGFKVEIYDVD